MYLVDTRFSINISRSVVIRHFQNSPSLANMLSEQKLTTPRKLTNGEKTQLYFKISSSDIRAVGDSEFKPKFESSF